MNQFLFWCMFTLRGPEHWVNSILGCDCVETHWAGKLRDPVDWNRACCFSWFSLGSRDLNGQPNLAVRPQGTPREYFCLGKWRCEGGAYSCPLAQKCYCCLCQGEGRKVNSWMRKTISVRSSFIFITAYIKLHIRLNQHTTLQQVLKQ